MSTILQDRSTTTEVEFIFDIDPNEPAAQGGRFDPTVGLALPSFEDPVSGTVAWLTVKGAVEVPKHRWLNGDLHRVVQPAGWSARQGHAVPEWITVEVFYTERGLGSWEILDDMNVEV